MELRDKSMYDVVQENLQRRNRRMFVHRLIYLFEYEYDSDSEQTDDSKGIEDIFSEMVTKTNNDADVPPPSEDLSIRTDDESLGKKSIESKSENGEEKQEEVDEEEEEEEEEESREAGNIETAIKSMMLPENIYYHDERLSGIMFMYDEPVGIHILEGSDAMLMNHIEALFKKSEEWTENLKNVKLVCSLHHVYRRINPSWSLFHISPLSPPQPIESPQTDEDHCELYEKCLSMLDQVKEYLLHGDSDYDLRERYLTFASKATLVMKLNKLMPPIELLAHLLYSPLLEDLKVYSYRLAVIPKPIPYHEMIWPLPTDHVPDFHDILLQKGETISDYTLRMKERRNQ